jgi:hypothetical protein
MMTFACSAFDTESGLMERFCWPEALSQIGISGLATRLYLGNPSLSHISYIQLGFSNVHPLTPKSPMLRKMDKVLSLQTSYSHHP